MVIDDNWTHFTGFKKKSGHKGLIKCVFQF